MEVETPGSPTSSGAESLTALLECELNGASPPGSPRSVHAHNRLPSDDVHRPDLELADTRPLKRPRSGLSGSKSSLAGTTCPPHPGFMHGMCIRCGQVADAEDSSDVALRYIHAGLRLSAQEAARIRRDSLKRILGSRKLLLVLDLDHTLLNSTRLDEVPPEQEEKLQQLLHSQKEAGQQTLYHLPHMNLWTKLRPGVHEFLARTQLLYEMHIYTHGNAEYAVEMAKLLDPTKRLFAERIISQADSKEKHVKDLAVVLGTETVTVILDDTISVWPEHQHNLMQVERYIFFPACAKRFGLQSPGLLQEGRDEDGDQGMLHSALQVLEEVHKRSFAAESEPGRDVRKYLAAVRGSILKGVHLVFSHIVPQNFRDPQSHPMWQLAEQLGATVASATSTAVTHVVAASNETDKAHWARKQGRHLVSPGWLHAAGCLWRRVDEAMYPVDKTVVLPQLNPEEDLLAAMAAAGGGTGPLHGEEPEEP